MNAEAEGLAMHALRGTLLTALMLSACSSRHGAFTGNVVQTTPGRPASPERSAAFLWAALGTSQRGEIEASLPDGEGFLGRYVELRSTTNPAAIDDLYDAWYEGWTGPLQAGWPHYSLREYIRAYEGKIVAVLAGDRSGRMRCSFDLDDPPRGMRGGGKGRCQRSNGELIDARFAASQEAR
jgi:hypothetical protein